MITRLRFIPTFLFLACLLTRLPAADSGGAPSAVQVQRAQKIAAELKLDDPAQTTRVADLVARQYYDLSLIHAKRDEALKAAKALAATDKAAAITTEKTARDEATAAQDALHPQYLAALAAAGLTPAQINRVKDGMTYGVLPLTFGVYREMLPQLTAEQQAQILAWLTEAREHAMDASTSGEKHAWFGKYKGRINNYLSKAGIDMKQAEKEMFERQKSAKTK